MRKPLKTDCFTLMRNMGAPIETIIDVGVQSCTPELLLMFKDKKQYLVEPVVEWNPQIQTLYDKHGVDYTLINAAASDFDGVMNIELSSVKRDQPITHARLTEKTDGANLREVPVRRVDSLVAEYGMTGPFLLKIDVDGAELSIIEGARKVLDNCFFVIVEAQVRNIVERMNAVSVHGFELFDIVDPCYHDQRLAQVDLVFINKSMALARGLQMYAKGFRAELWESFK